MKYTDKDFDRFWKEIQAGTGLTLKSYKTNPFVYAYNENTNTVWFVSDLHGDEEQITLEDFRETWKKSESSQILPLYDSDDEKILKIHSKKEMITAIIIRDIVHWW